MPAHINFFGCIGRKRVSTGEIDYLKMITFKVKIPFFSIDSHSAIITHMLVSTGCEIKQRSLSTIRITNQSYINSSSLPKCQPLQLFLTRINIFAYALMIVLMLMHLFCRFLFTDDFYHVGLLPAKRNLIT